MLSLVLQTTIISIIFIFLVHHLFNFFKTTLTVPKIKDLVNTPTKKYEEIYNTISNSNSNSNSIDNIDNINNKLNYDISELLPNQETKTMKSELKSFLKKQLHSNSKSNSNVIGEYDWSLNKNSLGLSDINDTKGFAPYGSS